MAELSYICPTCSRIFLAAGLLQLKVPVHPDALTARPCRSAGARILDCVDHGLNRGMQYLDQWTYGTRRPPGRARSPRPPRPSPAWQSRAWEGDPWGRASVA